MHWLGRAVPFLFTYLLIGRHVLIAEIYHPASWDAVTLPLIIEYSDSAAGAAAWVEADAWRLEAVNRRTSQAEMAEV